MPPMTPFQKSLVFAACVATLEMAGTALMRTFIAEGHPDTDNMQEMFNRQLAGALATVPINTLVFYLAHQYYNPFTSRLSALSTCFTAIFQADIGTAILKEGGLTKEYHHGGAITESDAVGGASALGALGGIMIALILALVANLAIQCREDCTRNQLEVERYAPPVYTLVERGQVIAQSADIELAIPPNETMERASPTIEARKSEQTTDLSLVASARAITSVGPVESA